MSKEAPEWQRGTVEAEEVDAPPASSDDQAHASAIGGTVREQTTRMGGILRASAPEIEALSNASEFGKVVYDRCPSNPKGTVLMVKHYHGTASMAKDVVRHPAYGQHFFRHQNAVLKTLHAVADACHKRLRFFSELLFMGEEQESLAMFLPLETPSLAADVERYCEGADADPEATVRFFSHVQQLLQEGHRGRAERIFNRHVGDIRFLLGSKQLWEGRMFGMLTEERIALVEEGETNWRSFVDTRKKDFHLVHTLLIEEIKRDCEPGHLDLVVLGGGHFATGVQSVSKGKSGLTQALQPFMLERFLEQSPALEHSRLVVFEPNHLGDVLNYPLA